MSYTYANRKRGEGAAPKKESAAPQPSMDALRAGLAKPTQEQMGRRVDLPDAMRAKMENAFGADLSAVKLYESEAVADAGANAITQGSNIAFAPGMLDFTSYGGQALLGHEISHVVSQQRGEVTGSGFLNDHALEARADREGAMAAAGQQIAMPTAALSTASAAPAAGPMQADKTSYSRKKASGHRFEEELAYYGIMPGEDEAPYDDIVMCEGPEALTKEQNAERKAWEKDQRKRYKRDLKDYHHHKRWGDFWELRALHNNPEAKKRAKMRHKVEKQEEKAKNAMAKHAHYTLGPGNSRIGANYYGWLWNQREKKLDKLRARYSNM